MSVSVEFTLLPTYTAWDCPEIARLPSLAKFAANALCEVPLIVYESKLTLRPAKATTDCAVNAYAAFRTACPPMVVVLLLAIAVLVW